MVRKRKLKREIESLERRVEDLEVRGGSAAATVPFLRQATKAIHSSATNPSNGKYRDLVSGILDSLGKLEEGEQVRLDTTERMRLDKLLHKVSGSANITKKDADEALSILERHDRKGAKELVERLWGENLLAV